MPHTSSILWWLWPGRLGQTLVRSGPSSARCQTSTVLICSPVSNSAPLSHRLQLRCGHACSCTSSELSLRPATVKAVLTCSAAQWTVQMPLEMSQRSTSEAGASRVALQAARCAPSSMYSYRWASSHAWAAARVRGSSAVITWDSQGRLCCSAEPPPSSGSSTWVVASPCL